MRSLPQQATLASSIEEIFDFHRLRFISGSFLRLLYGVHIIMRYLTRNLTGEVGFKSYFRFFKFFIDLCEGVTSAFGTYFLVGFLLLNLLTLPCLCHLKHFLCVFYLFWKIFCSLLLQLSSEPLSWAVWQLTGPLSRSTCWNYSRSSNFRGWTVEKNWWNQSISSIELILFIILETAFTLFPSALIDQQNQY